MNKYVVHFAIHASTCVTVEAESEEEAREIAMDEFDSPSLCHHCSNDLDLSDEGEICAVTKLD